MTTKWTELDAQERYRAVMMLIRGEATLAQLSQTFSVSRQVLSRAKAQAEQGALAALEPKKPGRKGKSEEQLQIDALMEQQGKLEKELEQEKKKVEIAQAFLELERTLGQGESAEPAGKKKNREKRRRRARRRKKKAPRGAGRLGTAARMAGQGDGNDAGDK